MPQYKSLVGPLQLDPITQPPQFSGPSQGVDSNRRRSMRSCFVVIQTVDPDVILPVYPERARLFTAPRLPQTVFDNQVIPFSIEEIIGSRPEKNRYIRPPRIDGFASTIAVPLNQLEFLGNRPERARLMLGARIPLPPQELTHVQAAFSVDMISADRPTQPRPSFHVRPGLTTQDNRTLLPTFSIPNDPSLGIIQNTGNVMDSSMG